MIKTLVSTLAAALLLWAPISAQDMPKVNQRQACMECHDDLADDLTKPYVHGPLKAGECTGCHAPHASRHDQLLLDGEGDLCASCHSETQQWHSQPVQHQPVADGQCTRCHDPHASDKANLLTASPKELCATCHTEVRDWLAKSTTHAPMKIGQCYKCHDVHGGQNDYLLTKGENELCSSCHGNEQKLRERHVGFDPVGARCSACHDPHASDSPGLVMSNKHAPFEEKDCAACHTTQQADGSYPLKGAVQQVCADCHSDVVDKFARYMPHGSTPERSCEQCHNAHASDQKKLLGGTEKQLCTKCHDPSRGVETVGENPHTKYACGTCHEPHGNERGGYLKKPILELCASCHQHQHTVAHPMGDKVTDPVRGGPLDCLSCHDLHAWTSEPLMIASGERDLCVRCHRDK